MSNFDKDGEPDAAGLPIDPLQIDHPRIESMAGVNGRSSDPRFAAERSGDAPYALA
jgi:hypothetical protein